MLRGFSKSLTMPCMNIPLDKACYARRQTDVDTKPTRYYLL